MIKEYLVFNIDNSAEYYISIFRFLDQITGTLSQTEIPSNLQNRIFRWKYSEKYNAEKMFAMIPGELEKGSLESVQVIGKSADGAPAGFIRVRHDKDDATIEYIYLEALLHRFPYFVCLLYTAEDTEQKYAVLRKAEEFFCGFSRERQGRQSRIFGEDYSYKDNVWQIVRIGLRKTGQKTGSTKHFKVRPIIELSEERNEIQFWRSSVGYHKENVRENDDRLEKVMERCRKDFAEDFKGNAERRLRYYTELFQSESFQKEVENMPLLAFYLFCMQMYYLKDGKVLSGSQVNQIRLFARDIADGLLQLMENIHHATGKVGFMSIRVHENTSEKNYLYKRYGINNLKYNFYYEIRLLDLSQESIAESFRRRMKDISGADKLQVTDFFRKSNNRDIEHFWKTYNQKKDNLVHHYGLQVFSTIISANEGVFKVISSSHYDYDQQSEKYVNEDNWEKGDSGQVHIPGTEYIILLPMRGEEQKFVTSVEVDAEYQYDMETDYEVCEYEDPSVENLLSEDVYTSQEKKEEVINEIASRMFEGLHELEKTVTADRTFVAFMSIEKWMNGFLEIYCKSLILCSLWRKPKNEDKFYCVINGCTENQILELARLFAIFYCKTDMHRYLSDMQIYLAGEDEELLITGRNLNSLYAVTSKIMLVKGISEETTNIMKYLLTQYGNGGTQNESGEKKKLVPFDILTFPGKNITLFEKNVRKTLEADIQKYSLGCKINDTHMRIGSKLHITSFFEAELLFHNNYYVSRFAELILRRLPVDGNRKIILVGYETYSELLLYRIVTKLRDRRGKGKMPVQASYMIYEQRSEGAFRYMDDGCLDGEHGLQFAIMIPINSTLTTHNKVRSALEEELERKGVQRGNAPEIIANYALILIRSSEGEELDKMEEKFWDEIGERTVSTSLIPQGEPDVEYFVCINTRWYSPLQCPACFPEKYADEKPLIETDRASIVPVHMLGMTEKSPIPHRSREASAVNLERVKALKNSLIYKHVIRNGNHYLYYFCLEKYFIEERQGIIDWLKNEKEKRERVSDRIVYDIIVSPLHYSNAGFLAEVNHYLFDDAALVLNFEVEKEFRENVKTKYSNIIGLYYNLLQIGRKALIRFHFVDDTIVSTKTYMRAKTLFQSLICPDHDNVRIEVFSDIVVLLNRMSQDSVASLLGSSGERAEEHFHAYVNLNISSMRNHEDACTECKLVSNFTNLRDQSSTNQQYSFWNTRREQHLPKEIQNKVQEKLLSQSDELRERAYKRMLCTHMFNERMAGLGHEKNDVKVVRKVMIELLSESQENQIEWLISYIKVFSRTFISFSKSNREAIFQIMLWIIEYMTENLTSNRKKIQGNKKLGIICGYIREQRGKSDKILCNLLIILMKRLSDLGSNYIIRKKNIVRILRTVDKFDISGNDRKDFRNRYIGVIKRICCQSSDENKSIYFEYLMLYGEEYGGTEPTSDTKGDLLYLIKKEKDFAEEAFLENTRVLNDGIRDLARDCEKSKNNNTDSKKKKEELLQEYYYENFRRLLRFYGYEDAEKMRLTEEGEKLLETLVYVYRYLGGKGNSKEEGTEEESRKDAPIYYQYLLELLERLTGAKHCYFLYRAVSGGSGDTAGNPQYYRIQAKANIEALRISDEKLGVGRMKADTYVPTFKADEEGESFKRSIVKYDIYDEGKEKPINTIFLQIDFPESIEDRRVLILLKMVMAFRGMILGHLRQDFSNNMVQKWSSGEYFNKQVMLQRATDHTDRDNLLKYYNEILDLEECDKIDQKKQIERNRALFHMVINSYIARMNVQLLAEANPEREPSRAAFRKVYDSQLKRLLESLQKIENCFILDENGRETFSESLLERRVRLRQTKQGESLSLRRISIIIAELVLSAISHSGNRKKSPAVYIYREGDCLVVKNQFFSRKGIDQVRRDVNDSVERKKDGISLAAIKGTVNDCYGLTEDNGVRIEVEREDGKKYFYVKLPILCIWEDEKSDCERKRDVIK